MRLHATVIQRWRSSRAGATAGWCVLTAPLSGCCSTAWTASGSRRVTGRGRPSRANRCANRQKSLDNRHAGGAEWGARGLRSGGIVKNDHRPAPASQRLWIEDFPQPALARCLSPNGRAHWAEKRRARDVVAAAVKLAAVRAGWVAVDGPVRVTFRYVRPTRGRVDLDNLSTGVSKACLDSLVRGGYLEDDDSRHVVAVTAEAAYEKGRRALEIRVEAAE